MKSLALLSLLLSLALLLLAGCGAHAFSHWTVAGSGFHRTATYEADFPTVILQPKDLFTYEKASQRVSLTFQVSADFYIDVNELWKRASFSLLDECGSEGFVFQRYPAERWRFVGSNASAPIDIEGPSFRSATVPLKTNVTLTFELLYSDAASAAAAAERRLVPLDEMQPRLDGGLQSYICDKGKNWLRMRASFPVHARYAAPIGQVPAPLPLVETFSAVNVQLLADHLLGRAAPHSRKLEFEHLKLMRWERTAVSSSNVLDATEALPLPERGAQRRDVQGRKEVTWDMPVPNARLAHVVYWCTTLIIIAAAVGVMAASVL